MATFQQFTITKEDHDNTLRFIKQAEAVVKRVVDDRSKVTSIYPNVDEHKDERIAVFRRLQYVCSSAILALAFMYHQLASESWWRKHMKKQMLVDDIHRYFTEFSMFAKVAFVQCLFSCVESELRVFLRAIDPSVCHGGAAEFKSVYECLFKSKLSKCPPSGADLLDLLRLVRNTVHNNGIYFHKNGNDVTVQWHENSYKFVQGAAIDFVTWDFIIGISDDIRKLLVFVVKDANLRAISSEIVS